MGEIENKSSPAITMALSGGLGNQLFQLSAGLFYSKKIGATLNLERSIGSARMSKVNCVEIEEFELPMGVKVINKKQFSNTSKKIYNGVLSKSLKEQTNVKEIEIAVLKKMLKEIQIGRAHV